VPFFIKPITKKIGGSVRSEFLTANLKSNLDFLEAQLQNDEYICGKLTGADFMLVYPLEKLKEHGTVFKQALYPKVWAYMTRMHGRASWVKAEKKIDAATKKAK
jgi:glutathione S-transferase